MGARGLDIEGVIRGGAVGRSAPRTELLPSMVEGTIVGVIPEGILFKVLPWDGGKHVFGPARFTRGDELPTVGDVCLVVFAGVGVSSPWVIGYQVVGVAPPPTVPGEHFLYTQSGPASDWVIAHGLGFYPNVTIISTTNEEVEGDVEYIDANNLVIHFSAPYNGTATLS